MTVRENLDLGAYLRRDGDVESDLERVYELFPRLKERERQKAGTMSGGEQQMLAIGRALMANPKLLLLDEPSMGIAPVLVERIYETIVEINRQGTTILLVEQNANYALEVSGALRARDRHGGARRPVGAARQPRRPEGVPRRMTCSRHSERRRCGCSTCGSRRRSWPRTCPSARATAARSGLAFGLLLSVVGAVIWLLVPARPDSRWKLQGARSAAVARRWPRRGRRARDAEGEAEVDWGPLLPADRRGRSSGSSRSAPA